MSSTRLFLFALMAICILHTGSTLKCYDVNYRVLHCPMREGYTFGCLSASISNGDDTRTVMNCYPGRCHDYGESVRMAGLRLDSCSVCFGDLCNADLEKMRELEIEREREIEIRGRERREKNN
ncbi:uncharacterized protein LOC113364258 [Ctenocephalides felis]|uniref:uncharacterized protein LOC113364258 n=1 Tax=Ctenocephalides felis TaxID=7515 RepID=UPI000E6E3F0F|nr:uncharacterized protein LOC113364258 [Ctenocephalides felis]